MKFCDKLPKLRKEKNYSQEGLAEKLNVSRQAISKWESGSSYPDMEKMIEICKVLNCTLENLMDDGVINNNTKNSYEQKNYLDDFLKYVTKLYNMFLAMKLKQKCSFAIEMIITSLLLFIFSFIIVMLINTLIFIPLGLEFLKFFFTNLLVIGLTITSIIIFFHILKIRYLDYYVTIKDNTIKEKVIEEEIDEKRIIKEKKKEVVIIRDPLDKEYSFFNILYRLWNIFLKIICTFIIFGLVFTFLMLMIGLVVSIYYIPVHNIFVYSLISIVGILLLNYVFIYFIFNFIFNRKNNKLLILINLIVSLIIIGIGAGLFITSLFNIEYYESDFSEIKTNKISKEYEINDLENLYYDYFTSDYYNKYISIVYDDRDNVLVEATSKMDINDEEILYQHYYHYDLEFNEIVDLLTTDLKDNKLRNNFDDLHKYTQITIHISEENHTIIKEKLNIN